GEELRRLPSHAERHHQSHRRGEQGGHQEVQHLSPQSGEGGHAGHARDEHDQESDAHPLHRLSQGREEGPDSLQSVPREVVVPSAEYKTPSQARHSALGTYSNSRVISIIVSRNPSLRNSACAI